MRFIPHIHWTFLNALSVGLLVVGLVALATDFTTRRRIKALSLVEREIKPLLERKHGEHLANLFHVGISPGKMVRYYDGDSAWDVGYLQLDGGVSYFGDQCDFHIPRRYIDEVRVVDRSVPLLQIGIVTPGHGRGWITIEARQGISRTALFATLQRLRAQIVLMNDNEASNLSLPAPLTNAI